MSLLKDRRCLIVGGGMTGCVSALLLADRGYRVTLCESSSQLGGVLRDHVSAESRFFSGCQYLSVHDSWFRSLPETLRAGCVEFEHGFGSVTEFGGRNLSTREVATPVFMKSQYELGDLGPWLNNDSLESRLSFYPEFIGDSMSAWAARHGIDLSAVCGENAAALQIRRVYLADSDAVVGPLKRQAAYDETLALPSRRRPPGHSVRAGLPASGFDPFFDALEQALMSKAVEVMKSSPVRVRTSGGHTRISSRRTELSGFDHVIWACNPNPLLKGVGYPALSSPYARSETHYFDLRTGGDSSENSSLDCSGGATANFVANRYYQVFSERSSIQRIFTYMLDGHPRMSVECFAEDADPQTIGTDVTRLMHPFIGSCDVVWRSSRREKRYLFYSQEDKRTVSELISAQPLKGCRIVSAGWLDFGRDAKIHRVMDRFHPG